MTHLLVTTGDKRVVETTSRPRFHRCHRYEKMLYIREFALQSSTNWLKISELRQLKLVEAIEIDESQLVGGLCRYWSANCLATSTSSDHTVEIKFSIP